MGARHQRTDNPMRDHWSRLVAAQCVALLCARSPQWPLEDPLRPTLDHVDLPAVADPPPQRRTRAQHGIVKPRKFTDGTIRYGNFRATGEPEDLHEAFGDSRWKQAMQDEIDALERNKTWHLAK